MLLQHRFVNESKIIKDNNSAAQIDFDEFNSKQRMGHVGNEKVTNDSPDASTCKPSPNFDPVMSRVSKLRGVSRRINLHVLPCSTFIHSR